MSTEVIETNLELMHLDLVTFINDEPLDMLEEFTDEEIATEVISIAFRLFHRDFCNGHLKKGRLDYLYSIKQCYGKKDHFTIHHQRILDLVNAQMGTIKAYNTRKVVHTKQKIAV